MSYSSKKGYVGEVEFASFLNATLKEFGHEYVRMGKQERNKKFYFGDVVINPKTDPKGLSVLKDYFLESKVHALPQVINIFEEAEANARTYGKRGSICYIVKQAGGQKRKSEFIVMSKLTFASILRELQGWRQEPPQD